MTNLDIFTNSYQSLETTIRMKQRKGDSLVLDSSLSQVAVVHKPDIYSEIWDADRKKLQEDVYDIEY